MPIGNSRVQQAFVEIKNWLSNHRIAQAALTTFNEPATDKKIAAAAKKLKAAFPEDLKILYLQLDGQVEDKLAEELHGRFEAGIFPSPMNGDLAYLFTPLADLAKFKSKKNQETMPGWVPGWLPIGDNFGGDIIALDLASTDAPNRGRILHFNHETGEVLRLAGSLGEYLCDIAEGLKKDRIHFDDESGLAYRQTPDFVEVTAEEPVSEVVDSPGKSKASIPDRDVPICLSACVPSEPSEIGLGPTPKSYIKRAMAELEPLAKQWGGTIHGDSYPRWELTTRDWDAAQAILRHFDETRVPRNTSAQFADPAHALNARFIEPGILGSEYADLDPKSEDYLNGNKRRAVACKKCARFEYETTPEPFLVARKRIRESADIFAADNGVLVVRTRILELLRKVIPNQIKFGPALFSDDQKNKTDPEPQIHWVRPTNYVGREVAVQFQEWCPDCGYPTANAQGMTMRQNVLEHYGDQSWDLALVPQQWAVSRYSRSSHLLDFAMSGRLYLYLKQNKTRGLVKPDDTFGVYFSLQKGEHPIDPRPPLG